MPRGATMRALAVTFASDHCYYQYGAKRLQKTLRNTGFDGDIAILDYKSLHCPDHQQISYGFKAYCLAYARDNDYDIVFYFDSSTKVLRPLQCLIDIVLSQGYWFHEAQHRYQGPSEVTGEYITDDALKYLGFSRLDALDQKNHVGSFIGLDLKRPASHAFIDKFIYIVNNTEILHRAGGQYDDYWLKNRTHKRQKGHRQQSVTTLVALGLNMVVKMRDMAILRPYGTEPYLDCYNVPEAILQTDRIFVKQKPFL